MLLENFVWKDCGKDGAKKIDMLKPVGNVQAGIKTLKAGYTLLMKTKVLHMKTKDLQMKTKILFLMKTKVLHMKWARAVTCLVLQAPSIAGIPAISTMTWSKIMAGYLLLKKW